MRSRAAALLVSLTVGSTSYARTPVGAPCPPSFVAHGRDRCVLEEDIVISSPIVPGAGVRLDCNGHSIRPSIAGTPGNVNSRSTPEIGILLDQVRDVGIADCVLDGFDFGIFAIGGADHVIRDGAVRARFMGISFFGVRTSRIARNSVAYTTNGGAAIFLIHGAQGNVIQDNDIDAALTAAGAVRVPGPVLPSNPVAAASLGSVIVSQTGGLLPTMFTAVIDGEVRQLTIPVTPEPDAAFTADNRITGNRVGSAVQQVAPALFISTSLGTRVAGNQLGGSQLGIQGGSLWGSVRQFPGSCTLDGSRRCLGPGDCNIPGIDVPPGLGSCVLPPTQLVFWPTTDARIDDNRLVGPFSVGIVTNGVGARITNNSIAGNAGSLIGIRLLGPAVESTTIAENSLSDLDAAFRFDLVSPSGVGGQPVSASFFGARVHGNVIRRSTWSVVTSNDYGFTSELSVDQSGNDWGRQCPDGFDADSVKRDDGSRPPVVDSFPICH